ncbi:diacylglycerol kinase family protein [Alkalihalobacillus sp. AL-G]|uniref:diacylglycerol kinase family protein n=1 Tax=Alkalihalobacillus sp. AL-G TaxID=2926399 RepID=UPI00272C078C|nr:diacylglycerol kinase family protein [Alkalihalobacillus sp. AL-G]WLD92120.1 diacylglycerol kinase family protein [Alkalihalobacillus sp. AL-G]
MIRQVADSFKCAIEGVKEGWNKERNFRIHCVFAVATIFLAFILQISIVKWVLLLITIGIVMSLELLNSGLERAVDLVTNDYHPIAKQAKDFAAASVFIFSLIAVIIGILLFAEPIIKFVS